MFYWGRAEIEKLTHILERIPGIPLKDIEKVRSSLQKSGVKAILVGPLFGIPYKIYAAYAHLITNIYNFLLISIPARGVRFVLVAFITPYIFDICLPDTSYSYRIQVALIIWTLIYIIYFAIKRK